MATVVGDLGKEAMSLVQIRSKPQLRLSFERWEESFKMLQTSIESKRARVLAAKNEMYLLSSFYFVFQGGMLNILISKADALKCYHTVFIFALSALASVGILCSIHDKFYDYHRMKFRLEKATSESRELDANMTLMLRLGASFSFATDDGRQRIPQATTSSAKWYSEEAHYYDVMLFLCTFSTIVLGLCVSSCLERC